MKHKTRVLGAVVAFMIGSGSVAQKSEFYDKRQVLVQVNQLSKGSVEYLIDSRPIQRHDLLAAFGRMVEEKGSETLIVVLVDGDLPIRTFGEIGAFAGKAGFVNIRDYVVWKKGETMSEIHFSPTAPVPTKQAGLQR